MKLMKLNKRLHRCIEKYCKQGDKLIESGDFEAAMQSYTRAKELLPEPVYDWEAATWIFVAIGETYYLNLRYEDALNSLKEAQKSYGGMGNPFILLRIGQCYYELNNMENALNYLLQAYMMEGEEIFANEHEKYVELIRRVI